MAGKEDRGDDVGSAASMTTEEAAAAAAASAAAEAEKTAAALEGAKGGTSGDEEDAAALAEAKERAAQAEAEARERDEKGRFAKSDVKIPKDRFDEAVAREREARLAAERELLELRSQLKADEAAVDAEALETEIKELEKAHAQALLKGDVDAAAETMSQIRLKERAIQIAASTSLSDQAKVQAREEARMDTAIERLEKTYDILNPEHESYDQGLVDLILASQRYYISDKGMLPSVALVQATEEVMGRFTKVAPPKEEPKKGLGAGEKGAADRKAAAVKAALDASKRQPPSTKETGLDSDKAGIVKDIDPTKLTMEEFAALPDATKSRLRGDMLEE